VQAGRLALESARDQARATIGMKAGAHEDRDVVAEADNGA